jgi:Putative 8-oxoguanine DNA glycosylase OGG-like protein
MNGLLCTQMREEYKYPPACLEPLPSNAVRGPTWIGRNYRRVELDKKAWRLPRMGLTSLTLDRHHHGLLNSPHSNDMVDGVVSVVYWGNFAASDGRFTCYAWKRAGFILLGRGRKRHSKPTPIPDIASAVAAARNHIVLSQYGNALDALMRIKFIGPSFASKIAAFLNPDHCGVLDKIISKRLQKSGNALFRTIRMDAAGYDVWCRVCSNAAVDLNAIGSTWTDWDGTSWPWRAIDVERAVFASDRDPADLFL